jgi:hypothetical protein
MARHLDGVIPNSTLHLHAGDGHLSIVTRHARSVLQALAGDRQAPEPTAGETP